MLEPYQRFPLDLRRTTKEEIIDYFTATYELFESLFDIFSHESVFFEQPEPLRHPLIFYYGHTATFYINKLITGQLISERINPHYESIFAIGVDEMSWDDLNQAHYQWPTVDEVKAYRQEVKSRIIEYINQTPLVLPIDWESPLWPIIMGIEHENIHLETSSVLHRQLPKSCVKPDSFGQECKQYGTTPNNELLAVPQKRVTLGLSFDHTVYGWDNEYGSYEEEVPSFKAAQYLTTNGEFLAFVNDRGYVNDEYWCEEGQAWKAYKKVEHPIFWIKREEGYDFRTLTDIIALPLDWPVEVNYLEAHAFCRWKSQQLGCKVSLPTEAMWHSLVSHVSMDNSQIYTSSPNANIHLSHYTSSSPVTQFQQNGFSDVVGNVWQWTQTPIEPFEGFKVHPLYDDFSVPTFDQRHNIIKGGSWISRGNVASIDSRYAFRRHFPQHAGFRYVCFEENGVNLSNNNVSHYNDPYENAYKKAAWEVIKHKDATHSRVLNMGCALGTAVFELVPLFDEVMGIDLTARNVLQAQQRKEKGSIEGCEFWQGDGCNLKPHFNGFDIILITNGMDEVYDVSQFAQTMVERLNQGGVIVLYSIDDSDRTDMSNELSKQLSSVTPNSWIKR